MPYPLELPDGVYKEDGRWFRICPECESPVSHLRRNYCIGAHNVKQLCKKCSVVDSHPAGMVGSVRVAWYNSFYKSAISRGYCWELDIEFIDSLYEIQRGRCAISGMFIGWSPHRWEHTASIDRIDNDKGYTKDNVQLVHKEVNMLRGSLSVERLIELSAMITEHNNK